MAKATIAMAMRETGFGQDALQYLPQNSQEPTNVRSTMPAPQYSHDDVHALDPNLRQHPSQQQKRPAPHFDMDLRDLFSEDEFTSRPSKMRRAHFSAAHSSTMKREQQPASYQGGKGTPMAPKHNAHQNYRRQQPSPQLYAPGTPIDPALQMPGAGPSASPSQHQHQQQQQQQQQSNYFTTMQPYSGPQNYQSNQNNPSNQLESLDFLEDFPTAGQSGGPPHHHHLANAEGAGAGAGGFPDYDLGFGVGGLAFDGGAGPSWDEHGGFDLFDGFFFGGGGGGAGAGGHDVG